MSDNRIFYANSPEATAFAVNFGHNFSRRRKAKGFTLKALASKTALSVNTISNAERGTVCCSLYTAHLLAHAIKMPLSDLIKPSEN